MKRMHIKKSRKKIKINKYILIVIFVFVCVFLIINFLNKKAVPIFNKYSKIETNKIISQVVNSSVTDYVKDSIDIDKLFITSKDSSGNVKNIDFNSKEVNTILSGTSKVVETNLKYLEQGKLDKLKIENTLGDKKLNKGIVFEIPSGIVFDNMILNNLFPKIPVKLDIVGNIICMIKTDIKEYGINSALITVNIDVVAEVRILLPISSTTSKIETNIPIIMKLIEGDIPSYYFDGYLNNPSLTTKVK